ncbi:unnamed protein product [Dicrocoelium dendriticum]|nr:unnamed protein product [Dicrocoelium dendriticum]
MLNHLKRLRERLRQKEDTDELLQPVDFEQLKIENSQYLSKIDQLNTEMQKVKRISGRIQQAVNLLKSSLHEISNEKTMIESEIAYRLDITNRVKDEIRIAKKMSLSHHKKLWAQTVRGTEISVA